jgi:rhombotail lipoprotein
MKFHEQSNIAFQTIFKPRVVALITLAILLSCMLLLSGCVMFGGGTTHRHASSVMGYLYPGDTEHLDTPTIPVLSLPLKVGIAFVPEENTAGQQPFTEGQKMTLMKQAASHFNQYPFVQSIQMIPTAYLHPKGGFSNVDQLKNAFGIDVMVLLSYDQVQFTDEGLLSLTYWTVVGAYVVRGEKNDTRTMMDAVVYDIKSRKLLFRAPGTSQIKASSTPINWSEKMRHDSEQGLDMAAKDMMLNLQEQLELFKEHVKQSPEEYKVVTKPGHSGLAAVGILDVALVAGLGGFLLRRLKKGS